jgi:glucose/arabinose dehydrogenase
MKRALWWWVFVLFGLLTAKGQGVGTYKWTNVVAFPGLPTFSAPISIASPPGETNRLFVCEHGGNIVVITNLAAPTRTVFMNLSSRVTLNGEAGLLAIAFHPGFATNGYFYVSYNGTTNSSLSDVVSRFKISASNTNQGDATSETPLYVQRDRAPNHNGGDLHFGPDNYLYISLGDEGDEHNTLHDAQHIDAGFFSGFLRIDVDKLPGNLAPNTNATALITTNYAVPADNPFVGATTFDGLALNTTQLRTEFWAVGLRNPWRFSFDPVTGTLYCGDVGQDTVEEVDIITKGGNYGWATYEGKLSPPPGVSTSGQPVAQNPIFPVIQYNHGTGATNGNCIIGGVVYRGSRFPGLNGVYVYGDYSAGKFWATTYDGTNATTPVLMFSGPKPTAFGVDPRNGDILFCVDGTTSLQRIIGLTPTINSISFNTTNIFLSGAGGGPGSNYIMLTSTDLVNWVNSFTGKFDALANFQLTNSTDTNAPQQFYRISR